MGGGRWEEGSGWGTQVYPWLIHVNVWQIQYSIVKQNKVKVKKRKYQSIPLETALFQETIFFNIWSCKLDYNVKYTAYSRLRSKMFENYCSTYY